MNRREFLKLLALTTFTNFNFKSYDNLKPFGTFSLLHLTDTHAQLNPIYYREPSESDFHLTGEAFLKQYNIDKLTSNAYAFSHLNFTEAGRFYGKVGGYAHIATLINKLRESRTHNLLLDGGDTFQGSATALWTKGDDMVQVLNHLGVDVMTAHWEFTYGEEQFQTNLKNLNRTKFVAQNIFNKDFNEAVFPPYVIEELNGVQVGIIGQAFPYTPIANPSYLIPNWTFGIQEEHLQKTIDELKSKGIKIIVLLSHNGLQVDLKVAKRVKGLDFILGGHTHDAIPKEFKVNKTVVINSGSHGKFVSVLDVETDQHGNLKDYRYQLIPVFSNLLKPDGEMSKLISDIRAPYLPKLNESLAKTEGLLYRRGTFNGSFDEVILNALIAEKDVEIALSPGFRWGSTVLPNHQITFEDVMNQTAITYAGVSVSQLKGSQIKEILEDIMDNLFNEDPYYQQGGDMVRVGGIFYRYKRKEKIGKRIYDIRLIKNNELLSASKTYKVASWASVNEANKDNEPIWDIVKRYLLNQKVIKATKPMIPIAM